MKVLFIEDDAMNRLVVRDMLRVGGVDMIEAENGAIGLTMIDQAEFDVILLDLRMPGVDGFEVLRMIRERSDEKAVVPVIVITADSARDLRARCIGCGADEFLIKPVVMEALFTAIGTVIAQKGSAAELNI